MISDGMLGRFSLFSDEDDDYELGGIVGDGGGDVRDIAEKLEKLYKQESQCDADDADMPYFATPASTSAKATTSTPTKTRENGSCAKMPPWLHGPPVPPTPLTLQTKLSQLRSLMSSKSHLSDEQIEVITRAMVNAVESTATAAMTNMSSRLDGLMDYLQILCEHMEMGSDALIAASFHYASCVSVRELQTVASDNVMRVQLDPLVSAWPSSSGSDGAQIEFDTAYLCPLAGSGIERYGQSAVRIALDAARLKGTEAVASRFVHLSKDGRGTESALQTMRSLLLSVNDGGEWRALAIRAAACLYRLKGLERFRSEYLDIPKDGKRYPTTPEEVRVAREALHVYAPLAHRLGMHRLKSDLENVAFRTLYRRQYIRVMGLLTNVDDDGNSRTIFEAPVMPNAFSNSNSIGAGMKSVLADITSNVKRILHEDSTLMPQIASISVTARVKEPYSLWRKMLRKRVSLKPPERGDRSVLRVHDAIALRVVLEARKLSANEPSEVTAEREKALCYYVQLLCLDQLPSAPAIEDKPIQAHPTGVEDEQQSPMLTDQPSSHPQPTMGNRFKDYIKNPKRNGYRSLHYSARTRWHGQYWPFEVQIRSAEMHRIAEFGLAAHWDYKADGKKSKSTKFHAGTRAGSTQPQDHGNPATAAVPASVIPSCGAADSLTSLGYASLAGKGGGGQEDDTDLFASLRPEDLALSSRVTALEMAAATTAADSHEQMLKSERVRARAERLAPYIEALSTARTDIARENVFVFLNQPEAAGTAADAVRDEDSLAGSSASGAILSLPNGASVLDVLREQEKRTGTSFHLARRGGSGWRSDKDNKNDACNDEIFVLRNGAVVSLNQRVESGDVLTLCIARQAVTN